MPLVTVRQDTIGLYIQVGYRCRPVDPSRFKVGEKVAAYHRGGSTLVGVGKDPGTRQYLETWTTTGIDPTTPPDPDELGMYLWYIQHRQEVWQRKLTPEEEAHAAKWFEDYQTRC